MLAEKHEKSKGPVRLGLFRPGLLRFKEHTVLLWHRADRSDWLLALVVILTASASFGLGRLSAFSEMHEPVSVTTWAGDLATSTDGLTATPDAAGGGAVIGNKNSHKYYYPWCASVKNMSPVNKVSFDSMASARAAGYVPGGNCAGLQ